jgi:hypothetical protein
MAHDCCGDGSEVDESANIATSSQESLSYQLLHEGCRSEVQRRAIMADCVCDGKLDDC